MNTSGRVKCSWITPDGEIHYVTRNENHDNELPSIYNTVRKAEKVCIRVSCGWGWNSPISQIQLPNKITQAQKIVLNAFNLQIDCFKKIKLYYFVGNLSRKMNYSELIELIG